MRSAGFNAWAVDYKKNKLQPESPAYLRFDLCLADHKRTFWRLLQHPRLLYVHFAPPCGTCSRARKIHIKDAMYRPVPLRSELHPRGLPGLQQQDPPQFMRVQLANELYDLMFDAVADLCGCRLEDVREMSRLISNVLGGCGSGNDAAVSVSGERAGVRCALAFKFR